MTTAGDAPAVVEPWALVTAAEIKALPEVEVGDHRDGDGARLQVALEGAHLPGLTDGITAKDGSLLVGLHSDALARSAISPSRRRKVREAQKTLNRFTKKYLLGVTPLLVDGIPGHATASRIMAVKFYLGYGDHRDASYKSQFVRRMRHQHGRTALRYSTHEMLATGAHRRTEQRAAYRRNHIRASHATGVGYFDGRPVAACAIPILKWCRANGWHGQLVSGYRTPEYSDSLCRRMCGRPRCPGLCAGRSSNHSGNTPARFAVDVSDYYTFARVVARCPLSPHIHNSLPRDRVHFSPSGN